MASGTVAHHRTTGTSTTTPASELVDHKILRELVAPRGSHHEASSRVMAPLR